MGHAPATIRRRSLVPTVCLRKSRQSAAPYATSNRRSAAFRLIVADLGVLKLFSAPRVSIRSLRNVGAQAVQQGCKTRPNGEFFANPADNIQSTRSAQSMGWSKDHALALRAGGNCDLRGRSMVSPRRNRPAAVQHCCDCWRYDHRHPRMVDIATLHRTRIELLGRRRRDDSHRRLCCTPQRPRAGHPAARGATKQITGWIATHV
jgi:hypothetical protein